MLCPTAPVLIEHKVPARDNVPPPRTATGDDTARQCRLAGAGTANQLDLYQRLDPPRSYAIGRRQIALAAAVRRSHPPANGSGQLLHGRRLSTSGTLWPG